MRLNQLPQNRTPRVYILHENAEWVTPLKENLDRDQTPYQDWNLATGQLGINEIPPEGVFYNRMSASSFTRGNLHAKDLTAPVLSWLEANGRRVVNKRKALQLEMSKAEQQIALQQFGLNTPHTLIAVGKEEALEAAELFSGQPFIVKPNQGGKGAGVQLFNSAEELTSFIEPFKLEELTVDGVFLIQEYIPPRNQRIVRMEFIGGKFYYAVQVNTGGGFELCPADACEIPLDGGKQVPSFTILENFDIPEIRHCEMFLAANDIEIAGMEFLENDEGDRYFYDVNTNTNYNRDAEERSGLQGMKQVASFLKEELEKI